MARIVHWGGQDYKVIDGQKSYGPFDKQEAEDFLKQLEDDLKPGSFEDFQKMFAPLRAELKKHIDDTKVSREEEQRRKKEAGEAELKCLSFKRHFSDSQRLS
jgi:hypothetical protein